ncbi:MAG: sugar ABC transporter permease [Anaerolineae bacterium]|nr:sugar ABC transporter permease [Phycisphaerae bacterium]
MTTAGPVGNISQTPRMIASDLTVRAHPSGGGGWNRRARTAPYLFLIPYFLVTLVFFLYPLIYATILAFYQTNGPTSRAFVGLNNFRFVLSDPDFHTALWNTTVFAFFSIFLQLPLSLALALMLNVRSARLKSFFRLAIFAPNLVGQVFVGILFTMLFAPRYGLINKMLHALVGKGLEMNWLQDPSLVMPALIICSLWMYVGFNMIYFLAALQNVDQSLVEAAKIDGAGPWNIFRSVTVPAIMPVATFVVITSTVGSFQLFELPYILLQGFGPRNSGMTVVGYLYNFAFDTGDLGTGAAVGWLLTFIILIISLVQLRLSGTMRNDR